MVESSASIETPAPSTGGVADSQVSERQRCKEIAWARTDALFAIELRAIVIVVGPSVRGTPSF